MAAFATWHTHHEVAVEAVGSVASLPAHVLLETASTLTRMPSGLAQPLATVRILLGDGFPDPPLTLPGGEYDRLLGALDRAGLRGGAVYDGLIGAIAAHHGARLLSFDARATRTYAAVGAEATLLA